MPIVPGKRGRSGLAGLDRDARAVAFDRSPENIAKFLHYRNWRILQLILSGEDPLRHYIEGVLVENWLAGGSGAVSIWYLHKQTGKDTGVIGYHAAALEADGWITSRDEVIGRKVRRVLEPTPGLIEQVLSGPVVDMQMRMLVVTGRAIMPCGRDLEPPAPGGPAPVAANAA